MPKRIAVGKQRVQTAESAMLALDEVAADCKAAGLHLLANLVGAAALQAEEDHKDAVDRFHKIQRDRRRPVQSSAAKKATASRRPAKAAGKSAA